MAVAMTVERRSVPGLGQRPGYTVYLVEIECTAAVPLA